MSIVEQLLESAYEKLECAKNEEERVKAQEEIDKLHDAFSEL